MPSTLINPLSGPRELRDSLFAGLQHRIASLEDLICRSHQEILRLKSEQNHLALSSKLPDEMLAEVFMYLAHGPPWVSGMKLLLPHITLIRVTHVCSRWRHIALTCPRLWIKPNFNKLECVKAMLNRAKPQLLDIEWNLQPPTSYDFSGDEDEEVAFEAFEDRNALILQTIPEARTLRIIESEDDESLMQFDPDGYPEAPFLEALAIFFPSDVIENPSSTFAVLQKIVGASNHNMKNIELTYRSLFTTEAAPFASTLSSITSLSILLEPAFYMDDPDDDQHTSPAQAIKCLYQFPNLTDLHLTYAFSYPGGRDEGDVPSALRANLPRLEFLRLEDYPKNIIRFLGNLVCPLATTLILCIKVDLPTSSQDTFGDLLNVVGTHIRKGGCLRSISVSNWPPAYSTIRETSVRLEVSPIEESRREVSKPLVTISLPWDWIGQPLLQPLFATLSCDEIDHLEYENRISSESADFWKMIGSLPKLKTLQVTNTNPALLEILKAKSAGTNSHVYFDALQYIRLKEWNFTKSRHADTIAGSSKTHGDIGGLLQVLEFRKENGVGVKHLELAKCKGFTQSDKQIMERICGVSWDEI